MIHRRKSYSYNPVIIRLSACSAKHARRTRFGGWQEHLAARSGSEKAFHGAACALLRRTALVAGLRKGAHPSIAACRRLTYEALVTPRFCAVDSNSTRHGRNRRGFKKKKRKKERAGVDARAQERERGRGRQRMAEQSEKTDNNRLQVTG